MSTMPAKLPMVDLIRAKLPCIEVMASPIAEPTTGRKFPATNFIVFNVTESVAVANPPCNVKREINSVSKNDNDVITVVFTDFAMLIVLICVEVEPMTQKAKYIPSNGTRIVADIREIICIIAMNEVE